VAVGVACRGGPIVCSRDGTNWVEQQDGIAGYHYLSGVSFGTGLFVAVGSDLVSGVHLITSPDGMTWTPRSPGTDAPLNSVAYGNGIFVAGGAVAGRCLAGACNVAMTSADGITWTPLSIGGGFRISFGNGTFVALARNGNDGGVGIVSSTDGVTWTHRYSPYGYRLEGVTFGNDSFIAVGSSGTILQSGTLVQFLPTTARLGDGTMRMILGSETGAVLALDASTNLVDWTPVATLTNSLGTVSYVDSDATNFNQRFYRARQISE